VTNNYHQIKNFLRDKRTISISNICDQLNIDINQIIKDIKLLEFEKEIRVVNSSCTLNCSSCSTCGEEKKTEYLETTIVIPLHKKGSSIELPK